jgi:protein-S-isoprenylcysteine O-methyltransferase Ste14
LWTGAALYLIQKLVPLVEDSFPNVETIKRLLPRGVLKIVVMFFIARWWSGLLTTNITDPDQMVKVGFVFMGVPGLALTILGWFGRYSTFQWKQTWLTRIGGLLLTIFGFLLVRGIILG